MAYCRQCGAEVKETDRFCGQCGARQQAESQIGSEVAAEQASAGTDPARDRVNQGFRYQGVGIRFVAQIFDGLICLVFFFIIGSTVAARVGGTTPDGFAVEGGPALLIQALTFVAGVLYFALLETFWNGQTLGKKIARIQVVRADGSVPDFTTSLIRNVFRFIDGFAFYLVAAIFVWLSPKKQRLGDRVAGTFVIKKQVPAKEGRKRKKKNLRLTSRDTVFMPDVD